jgi:hypothetical protein
MVMRTSTSLSLAHRAGAAVMASLFAFTTLAANATPAYADGASVSGNGKGTVGGALLGAEIITIPMGIAEVHSGTAYLVGGGLGLIAGGIGGYLVDTNTSDGRAPAYMLVGGLGLIIPALVLSLNATRYIPQETGSEDRAPTNAPAANPGSPSYGSVAPGTAAPATAPAPLYTPPPSASSAPLYTPPPSTPAPTPAPAGAPAPAPTPASATPAPATPAPAAPPPAGGGAPPPLSLFDVTSGSMRMGVPLPEVRPMFTMAELRQYGMAQQTEVRMPLVKVTF